MGFLSSMHPADLLLRLLLGITFSTQRPLRLTDFASQGGHWYAQDGTPTYTIEKAKGGGLRPTTLRDARKLDLVPSVTGILKMQVAPQLEMWKVEQAVTQAKKTRKLKDETDKKYAMRVFRLAMQQVRDAADEGSNIHGLLENYFLSEGAVPVDYSPYISGTLVEFITHNLSIRGKDWSTEKSFAKGGFGGKCDLHNKECVLDFKAKEFNEENLPKTYDNHAIQLAAYRYGLGLGDVPGYICFVSRSKPGLSHIIKLDSEELDKGWEIFKCLLKLWQIDRSYTPKGVL